MHALHTHTILLTLHNVFVLLSAPYLPFTQGVCLVACLVSFYFIFIVYTLCKVMLKRSVTIIGLECTL